MIQLYQFNLFVLFFVFIFVCLLHVITKFITLVFLSVWLQGVVGFDDRMVFSLFPACVFLKRTYSEINLT